MVWLASVVLMMVVGVLRLAATWLLLVMVLSMSVAVMLVFGLMVLV